MFGQNNQREKTARNNNEIESLEGSQSDRDRETERERDRTERHIEKQKHRKII